MPGRIIPLLLTLLIILPALPLTTAQQVPPREETVIIGGGMWSPPTNFNPLVPWSATTGTVGLIYETLYIYLPHTSKLIPWLASEEPTWLSNDSLQVKLRDAAWWDGTPLTSADVKFTFYDLPKKIPGVYYSTILEYLLDVETPDDKTVIFKFNTTTINYPQIYSNLYGIPVLPKHIFEPVINEKGGDVLQMEVVGADKPENIVGSGMYRVYMTTEDTFYMVRVDNWWGSKYFGTPGPKYIKYVTIFSNQVALALLMRGDLDWSNFFIPGVPDLIKRYDFLVTWYKDRPYYPSSSLAYLFVNHAKKPLNDPNFRKAMYYAIDVDRIVNEVFEGGVIKSNPVGLMWEAVPSWKEFYAADLVNSYGYGYNPEKAKQILDSAGYKDIDGDGWREAPDGSKISLEIIVPYGWTDWMQAIIIIADNLKAVGIKAEASFPAYGVYADKMYKGEFDLLINSFGSLVAVPLYNFYNWLLWPDAPPPGEYSYSGNFGRYRNENVTRLLDEIAHTPLDDTSRLKQLYYDLQKILLDEMPYLPLWYQGYWFVATTLYWTGWPTQSNPYGIPTSWAGRWGDGGLLVLLNLKPVKATPTPSPTTSPAPTPTQTPSPTPTPSPPVTQAPAESQLALYAIVAVVIVVIAVIAVFLLRRRRA